MYGANWAGIPTDLSNKVQQAYDTPCLVSLGVGGAWFVMWPDGYYSWKFYGNYAALDKILDEAQPRSVAVSQRMQTLTAPFWMLIYCQHLTISPYNKHQFFVAFKDQTVKYSLSSEWMPQMREVFTEWQAEILQKQLAAQRQSQSWLPHRYSVGGPYPPAPQPSWNHQNYPPTPNTPQHLSPVTPGTPMSGYATPAPSFSTYSPYGDPAPAPPNTSPKSVNAVLARTQPKLPRMMSSASAGAIEVSNSSHTLQRQY